MKPFRPLSILVAACAALVIAGCSGMDDILGGRSSPPAAPAPSASADLSGTVRSVDAANRTIWLGQAGGLQSNLRDASRQAITYDASTSVEYRGQKSYNPQDLEVGDQIQARVERTGDRMLAKSITVLTSVSDTGSSGGANAPTTWNATVRAVNPANRSIELVQAGREQTPLTVYYEPSTPVQFQNRTYKPEDLERGDVVQLRTRLIGNQLRADQIVVTQNVSAGNAGAPAPQQLRGTIRSVDQARRSIELEGASWAQSFDTRSAPTTRVEFDASTVVEYRGQRYGVANLEPGDRVSIEVGPIPNGYIAKRIVVSG